uniref:Uncharacterized protein n=1 Tax=uncultured marine microorganism HF4000_009L19 TaxID=455516 RepID=B3T1E9_9ZZZZ|nr:hypothetical protein ALOHA_HF4000009L19ctg1g5 [uncultured marine microorganism HF4000_009L19]
MDEVDDQRIVLPATARVAHPKIDVALGVRTAIHVDGASDMHILVQNQHTVGKLQNLKRIGHIRDAGHPGHIALGFGVCGPAAVKVLLFFRQRPRLIGNLIPLHDASPGGHSQSPRMVLNIPRGRVEDLPNALQVGLAVDRAWRRIRWRGGLLCLTRGGCRQEHGHGRHGRRGPHRPAEPRSHLIFPPSRRIGRDYRRGALYSGAPVPDEPAKKLRPSRNLTVIPLAVGVSSLASYPSTTISSPGGKSLFRRPRLNSEVGLPSSTAQFTISPSGPCTSM